MKKLIILFNIIIFTMLLMSNVSAAELEIKNIEKNTDGSFNIQCSISGEELNQWITVFASKASAEGGYTEDIVYINQFKPEVAENGLFSFNIAPMSNFMSESDYNEQYILRIGGTSIENPKKEFIVFSQGMAYKAGDVNGDGEINEVDAALILKYLSDTYKNITIQQINSADYNKDNEVNIKDVIDIMEYIKK